MGFKKRGLAFLFLVIFLSGLASALGAAPSSTRLNFEPGLEVQIPCTVFTDTSKDISISAEGDLAEYITLDKNKISSEGGGFVATLKLPNELSEPGYHRSFIVIKEVVDPELASMIETAIIVRLIVDVFVPYPGRYLELKINGNNANIGEPITFYLDILSRGDEDISISPKVNILDSKGTRVETLFYTPRILPTKESLKLKKELDTTNYNPGNYKAVAEIDYGILATSETNFRIGNLSIEIVNYSNLFLEDSGIVPFDVFIESGWNDFINGVYAEIKIYNESGEFANFKSTTASLTPWEEKTITGYFETENFTVGTYDADITLNYYGKGQGSSTFRTVKVFFQEKPQQILWYYIGGCGLLLLVIVIVLKYFIFRKHRKNGKRKKR